jgi:superfamily II DNA/RNA helicase
MIVQAPAGSGKTGAFGVSSILRVDKKNDKVQVMVICNTRELCNQIYKVYSQIVKGTGIGLSNLADKDAKPSQINICVHGFLEKALTGKKKLDLTSIRTIVVDEADWFFKKDNFELLWKLKDYKNVQDANPQWILFSATYPQDDDK